MAASSRREVVLNIYELTDEKGSGSWMRRVGLGTWHTGVEVGGVEYTFAQNGIFFHVPRMPIVATGQVITLKESMPMGEHVGSANEVRYLLLPFFFLHMFHFPGRQRDERKDKSSV